MHIPDGEYGNIPLSKPSLKSQDPDDNENQYLSFDAGDLQGESRNLAGMSQPTVNENGYDDSFARKTWTDLARGKTQTGKKKKEKGDVSSIVPDYSLT